MTLKKKSVPIHVDPKTHAELAKFCRKRGLKIGATVSRVVSDHVKAVKLTESKYAKLARGTDIASHYRYD